MGETKTIQNSKVLSLYQTQKILSFKIIKILSLYSLQQLNYV